MARFVGSMCGESCPCAERRQRCPSDGEGLRMPNLYFKNEGLNPTGSFKDRGTLAGMQRAAEIGARAVLILVEGDDGDLYHESVRIGDELGICFISSDDPFRVEGQRTVALEICEQIGGEPPDYIFMPLSSGGNMSSVLKGLAELRDRRAIDRMPKVIGVQAEGAAPIARALAQGKDRFESLRETHTICKAITNPNPPSGNRILMRLEGGKLGSVVTVTDEEALGAQRLLAETDGIWGQPDSAVPLAAIQKAIADGSIDLSARDVAIVTGSGLKDQSIFKTRPPRTTTVPLGRLSGKRSRLSRRDGLTSGLRRRHLRFNIPSSISERAVLRSGVLS